MNDTATATMSKADELREKRLASARQKTNRLYNEALEAMDSLSAHIRETSGILNEDQAGIVSESLGDRVKVLATNLAAHVAAPPAGAKKKAKPQGVSLF